LAFLLSTPERSGAFLKGCVTRSCVQWPSVHFALPLARLVRLLALNPRGNPRLAEHIFFLLNRVQAGSLAFGDFRNDSVVLHRRIAAPD
jgi:hypothetical protein